MSIFINYLIEFFIQPYLIFDNQACIFNNLFPMNKLQLPHAKLFYMIAELSKKQLINDTQKRILKQKTISDDIQIFKLLDKYEKEKNQDDFSNWLIDLARNKPAFGLSLMEIGNKQRENEEEKKNDSGADQPNEGVSQQENEVENKQPEQFQAEDTGIDINDHTEVSSPVGTSLHLQKYKHSLNMTNVIKNQLLQPKKISGDGDSNL